MPLRDDLLTPIPGDNPGGQNLKYNPLYDKIKEARREDDTAAQGEWQRALKVADWNAVIKLAGEALATKSKDLQLAAWLTEAQLKREGFPGLLEGIRLMNALVDGFWEHLYPEIEDGDAELRAVPLEWVGTRLGPFLRMVPITKNGLNSLHYKESRTVGYEADATDTPKQEARAAAIADGKTSGEAWDESFKATPKEYYRTAVETLDRTLEELESLNERCKEKFGPVAPSFTPLREMLEEVRHTVYMMLQRKRELEPDGAEASEVEQTTAEPEPVIAGDGAAAAAPARQPVRRAAGLEPADRDDAIRRLIAVAEFLRKQEPQNPAAYLILRGLRWGELRANGETFDPSWLEPPATDARQQLKRLALEGNWQQLLEAAEAAMGQACGRAWLDLQRYVDRACDMLGYTAVQTAIRSHLKALLTDLPALTQSSMMDDTPTANAETMAWISTEVSPAQELASIEIEQPLALEEPAFEPDVEEPAPNGDAGPDAFELAMQAARSGRASEGIEILVREAVQERSGRARFRRKLQIAQICMATGNEAVACPILEELTREIDEHHLENWEAAEVVTQPLVLLLRCLVKVKDDPQERARIYARICRLDPVQALGCSR